MRAQRTQATPTKKATVRTGKRAAAAAVLAAMLLTGCAGQNSALSGQDDDSLSVTPAADAVIEAVAENGKIYNYLCLIEQTDEQLREMAVDEKTQELQLEENREPTQEELDQLREQFEVELKEEMEVMRQHFQELDPVLSAQEAANIATVAMENDYGIDLSDSRLLMECKSMASNDGTERVIWDAQTMDRGEKMTASASCTIDATTRRILMMSFYPSWQELKEIGEAPLRSFVTLTEDERYLYPTDSQQPDWKVFFDQVTKWGETFAAQTGLDQGLAEPIQLSFQSSMTNAQMFLVLQYKDGTSMRMELTWAILPHEYGDDDPYPGKWFNLYPDPRTIT